MRRRDFLKTTGSGIVVPTLVGKFGIRAFGSSRMASALDSIVDTDKVLVMIYLNGGNDGLNTVVPLDQLSKLNDVRSHVVLPESSLLPLEGTSVGLHPALEGFKDLYDEGRLQIIQNVGYPNQNFSHFRSTDIWMSGSNANELINNGWTGRYLNYEYPNYPVDYPNEIMPDPLAIEIGYSNSLLFQGPSSAMGMVINNPTDFYNLVDNIEDEAPDTHAGERLNYVRLIARQSQLYGEVVKNAAESVNNQLDYPSGNYLAEQLKIVARLIAGGLKTRMYMIQLGGFDTHDNQVAQWDHTQGEHANLLRLLGDAVRAFMDDADHLNISDRITGMTFSEFGRRIISNASYGTDHGAAAPLFVFGNHVNGGILGQNPDIPENANYQDNLEMEFDFRQIYATMFKEWFCVPDEDASNLLFNDYNSLPIIKDSPCSTTSVHYDNAHAGTNLLEVSPNPVNGIANIHFESLGGTSHISIHDMTGRLLHYIVREDFPKGHHQVSWNSGALIPGNYYVRLVNKYTQQTKKIIKI